MLCLYFRFRFFVFFLCSYFLFSALFSFTFYISLIFRHVRICWLLSSARFYCVHVYRFTGFHFSLCSILPFLAVFAFIGFSYFLYFCLLSHFAAVWLCLCRFGLGQCCVFRCGFGFMFTRVKFGCQLCFFRRALFSQLPKFARF